MSEYNPPGYNPSGQQAPVGTVPLWRITSVKDTTAIVGAMPQAVKRVFLTLFDDTDTWIDVPVESYNAATVKRMADQLSQNHMQVVNQQGEPVSLA